MLICEADDG